MTDENTYKKAWERERQARQIAEDLLDEKTRALYNNVVELEATIAELKQTQAQLLQSEKMATIGQLAAGVAHEINNPVGFVLGNTTVVSEYIDSLLQLDAFVMNRLLPHCNDQVSQSYLTLREEHDIDYVGEDALGLIDDSLGGLNRIKDIVANLKVVSHRGPQQPQACDINDTIEQALKLVLNEIKYKMEIRQHLTSLPTIQAHPAELQQVWINLFVNAAHACQEEGILEISTAVCILEAKQWIAIYIKDNGSGMDETTKRRLFDPFYTTKPVGVGTGLGLSVSFGIIEHHQGKITVESSPGKGSTFTILLPLQ